MYIRCTLFDTGTTTVSVNQSHESMSQPKWHTWACAAPVLACQGSAPARGCECVRESSAGWPAVVSTGVSAQCCNIYKVYIVGYSSIYKNKGITKIAFRSLCLLCIFLGENSQYPLLKYIFISNLFQNRGNNLCKSEFHFFFHERHINSCAINRVKLVGLRSTWPDELRKIEFTLYLKLRNQPCKTGRYKTYITWLTDSIYSTKVFM